MQDFELSRVRLGTFRYGATIVGLHAALLCASRLLRFAILVLLGLCFLRRIGVLRKCQAAVVSYDLVLVVHLHIVGAHLANRAKEKRTSLITQISANVATTLDRPHT